MDVYFHYHDLVLKFYSDPVTILWIRGRTSAKQPAHQDIGVRRQLYPGPDRNPWCPG